MNAVAGKSLLDLMWGHLDRLMDELMAPAHEGGAEELAGLRGEALGWAQAIALTTNPYVPLVDVVREEAVERWEARQETTRTQNERSAGAFRPDTRYGQDIPDERAARRAARRKRRAARNR